MKHLMVVSLACLLSACVSNATNISQVQADKVAEFPARGHFPADGLMDRVLAKFYECQNFHVCPKKD
jgi:hypothetical protein